MFFPQIGCGAEAPSSKTVEIRLAKNAEYGRHSCTSVI